MKGSVRESTGWFWEFVLGIHSVDGGRSLLRKSFLTVASSTGNTQKVLYCDSVITFGWKVPSNFVVWLPPSPRYPPPGSVCSFCPSPVPSSLLPSFLPLTVTTESSVSHHSVLLERMLSLTDISALPPSARDFLSHQDLGMRAGGDLWGAQGQSP